jgi:acetyl-CoA carboxylase biotin carboxyl carrier protein
MDIKELKELIHEILQSDISEFELEHTGTRLRLCRVMGRAPATAGASTGAESQALTGPAEAPGAVVDPAIAAQAAASVGENGLHLITSPIVGTFYRAPAPGAEPFVKLGSMVEEGSTLCIIEAMKLMNEIPSDVAGEIAAIYVENGQPVEFGQKLFGIRPRG